MNIGGNFLFNCLRCGLLMVTEEAVDDRAFLLDGESPAKIDAISHLARSWEREGKYLRVDTALLTRWKGEARLSSPAKQLDNLILWLGSDQGPDFDPAQTFTLLHQQLASIVGGRAQIPSMDYLTLHSKGAGLIELTRGTEAGIYVLRLSFEGWRRYEELLRARSDSRSAFMAMQFNDENVDRAFREAFKPGAKDAGFDLRLLTEKQPAGLIDDQLRVAIRTARFLMADLSTGNKGAYWEAGFAEGLGRPVIYVCEASVFDNKDTSPHFDTSHMLTVKWSLDDLPSSRDRIAATIRNTFPNEAIMPAT